MKNKLIYTAFMLAFITAFTACSNDDYDEPNSFSDVSWYTSAFRDLIQGVNINDFASFSDLSQGAVSHKWTIEEGSYFLDGPINRNDTVYDKFIHEPISNISTDETVHVMFTKSGLRTVNLYNEFDEYVEFRGADDFVFPAKEIGGKWVIDTTFVVDVYDTIVPQIQIRQNGAVVAHELATDIITVEAGSSLEFVDLSTTGRPNTRSWTVAGITNADSLAVIQFNKLGTFSGNLNLSRQGENLPGDFENYKIPAVIEVIPSSLPFEVASAVTELENQTIQVPYNGEFELFSDPTSAFSVTVNGDPFVISSVTLNNSDATKLDVKLQAQIYRSDDITISYDGSVELTSTDTRVAQTFTDLPVEMFQHEVIVFDFETGGSNWGPHAENMATTTIEISTEQAVSGTNSLKVDSPVGGNWSAFENSTDTYRLDAGVTVQYEYKVYKVSGTSLNFLAPWVKNSGGNVQQFWHNNIASAPFDTWVTIRAPNLWAAANTGDDYFTFFRHNGTGTLYFDDIRIIEVDDRP